MNLIFRKAFNTKMQTKKQQLEPDMQQRTGSKSGKEYIKGVYAHLIYLNLCRVYHAKCWAGWITSWNQDCLGKYQNLRYADDTTLMAESKRNQRVSWRRWKKQSEKTGLKHNIQQKKIMASSSITSWQIDGKRRNSVIFYFLGLQNHCR